MPNYDNPESTRGGSVTRSLGTCTPRPLAILTNAKACPGSSELGEMHFSLALHACTQARGRRHTHSQPQTSRHFSIARSTRVLAKDPRRNRCISAREMLPRPFLRQTLFSRSLTTRARVSAKAYEGTPNCSSEPHIARAYERGVLLVVVLPPAHGAHSRRVRYVRGEPRGVLEGRLLPFGIPPPSPWSRSRAAPCPAAEGPRNDARNVQGTWEVPTNETRKAFDMLSSYSLTELGRN